MRCVWSRCVTVAMLLCSAGAQELPRRVFKFGAIVSGDEGLRTTETHGEHNPAKKLSAMRAWVQRTQDIGGIPVGYSSGSEAGEPSIGYVDFELVEHPQYNTEDKPCRDQAAMIADDTAFVQAHGINAVFLADCNVLNYQAEMINNTITGHVPKDLLAYISFFNRARYDNFAALGVTVFHADAQNSEMKGYFGENGWSVDVDRTTKGKALVKRVGMFFETMAGYAPKVAIVRLNENGWYANRVATRVEMLNELGAEVVYNEVLAPFSNGCKEPIYGTPCENGESGGASDGCCDYDNVRMHMNAVAQAGANVLVAYVWCEGRIMQDMLREMNIHMDVFYSINCIDSQLDDGVDPEDLQYIVTSKVWTPDSRGVDPLFGSNQGMIASYEQVSEGVDFAALDDWTARYPVIGTILSEAVRSSASFDAVFDFAALNLVIQENVLPETYFGEIRYRNFRYNNGFETIEAQMLPLDGEDTGTVAVTVLPDSMAAQPVQMPMPTWECRGEACDCPPGTEGMLGLKCQPCDAGFASTGQDNPCAICPSGTYSLDSAANCTSCPIGTFQRIPGSDFCEDCPLDYECTGGSTEPATCQPGFGPIPNTTGCQSCVGNNYSEYGHCLPCLGDHIEHSECVPCQANQAADPAELGCRCAPGFVNTTTLPQCIDGDYDPFTEEELESMPVCVPCSEMPCIAECHDNTITVAPGWTTYDKYAGADRPIFKCRTGEACPGGQIDLITEEDSKCEAGYEGVLCGNCAAGYYVGVGGTCLICDGTGTWSSIALLVLGLMFFGFVLLQVKRYYQYFTVIVLVLDSDLQTISKVVIAAGQIIAGVAAQLNLQMPEIFASFTIQFLGIFRFDLTPLLGLGCIASGTYVSSLLFNFSLVGFVVLLVVGHWRFDLYKLMNAQAHDPEAEKQVLDHMYDKIDRDGDGIRLEEFREIVQKISPDQVHLVERFFAAADTDNSGIIDRKQFQQAFQTGAGNDSGIDLAEFLLKAGKTEVRQDAVGRLFLIIFLLYPQITSKVFEAYHCRDLGDGESADSVLLVDYTINCGSSYYGGLWWVATFLVVLWPFGVPATLAYQLYKHKELIEAEDEDTMQEFDFIIGDYKPEFFFWEVVELSRKLVLSGLIGLVGRGSVAQCVFASFLAFFFFGLSLLCRPYAKKSLNVVKLISEFQIFGVLLCCVVLQVNAMGLANERVGEGGYGILLVVITMMIIPVSLVFVHSSLQDAVEQRAVSKGDVNPGEDSKHTNPMMADMDFVENDDDDEASD